MEVEVITTVTEVVKEGNHQIVLHSFLDKLFHITHKLLKLYYFTKDDSFGQLL